jgi:predicted transcriptional regulator
MLRKEKLHLLPPLLVIAAADGSPVTYLVLSLRLAGLGGDRSCRAFIDELTREGLIHVERKAGEADQREKAVSMTEEGWVALRRYAEVVASVARPAPT